MSQLRLLAGPSLEGGTENWKEHYARLGGLPLDHNGAIETLLASGLRGRGGAGFLVGEKWRAVAERSNKTAVVVANGAEGEPLSWKDQILMRARPHLILDGVLLAAQVVKAQQIVLYLSEAHQAANAAMTRALAERPEAKLRKARVVSAPARYIAGEASAVVHQIESGLATPTSFRPAHLKGVNNSSTLVQNVESLAQVALIARYGLDWYRQAGQRGASGTVLLSVSGAVKSSGVIEVEAGSSVREAVEMVGGHQDRTRAVLLGGYFGSWIEGKAAMNLPLDAALLHDQGLSLGCGVIAVLGAEGCGVCETAKVMRYLANESAAQCGPCFFGLRALAEACERVASRGATTGDREQLERWVKAVRGRGACRHPDGASVFLLSALTTFASEFTHHPAHWSQRGE